MHLACDVWCGQTSTAWWYNIDYWRFTSTCEALYDEIGFELIGRAQKPVSSRCLILLEGCGKYVGNKNFGMVHFCLKACGYVIWSASSVTDACIDTINALPNILPKRNHRKLPENEPSRFFYLHNSLLSPPTAEINLKSASKWDKYSLRFYPIYT